MTLSSDLLGDSVEPALMFDLLFDDLPQYIWTRSYPVTVDSIQYLPLGGLGGGLTVRQSLRNKSLSSSAALQGHSPELLAQALTSPYQNRTARIYLAAIGPDGQVLSREILMNGIFNQIGVLDDGIEPILDISVRSRFAALEIAQDLRYTPQDQAALVGPDDSFFDFTIAAQSGNLLDPGDRNPSNVTSAPSS